jgi:hypothetical protein
MTTKPPVATEPGGRLEQAARTIQQARLIDSSIGAKYLDEICTSLQEARTVQGCARRAESPRLHAQLRMESGARERANRYRKSWGVTHRTIQALANSLEQLRQLEPKSKADLALVCIGAKN